LLNKHHFLDNAESVNINFTDSGLFGLRLTGSSDHAKDVLNHNIAELKRLTQPINADELNRAKNSLKT